VANKRADQLRSGERVILDGRDNRVVQVFPGVASTPLMTVFMVDEDGNTTLAFFTPGRTVTTP
jgi:hypothetical protein